MSLFPEVDKEVKQKRKEDKIKIDILISKSKEYRPSSGTEGMWFEDKVCIDCNKNKNCMTLIALQGGRVSAVRQTENHIFCIKHTKFNIEDFKDEIEDKLIIKIEELE